MNRREAIGSIAATVAATTVLTRGADAKNEKAAFIPVAAGTHKVAPLTFNSATLRGLSEKLLTSHHANNCGSSA